MKHKVNLNGDTRETLMAQVSECSIALGAALAVLSRCGPHGRNYQTVSPEAYALDRAEHLAICEFLRRAQVYYSEAAEALYFDDPNSGDTK